MASGVIFSESLGWASTFADLYSSAYGKWSSFADPSGTESLASGTTRGKAVRFLGPGVTGNTAGYLEKQLGAQYVELTCGFAFNPTAFSSVALPVVQLVDGTTVQVDLRIQTDGALVITRNGTTIAGPSTTLFPAGSGWYYFWLRVKISATVGTVKLIATGAGLSGSTILSGSSLNTQASANTQVNAFRLGGGVVAQRQSSDFYWTDIVIIDATVNAVDKLGNDVKVEYLAPNADGFYNTAWPPNTGASRFGVIDEVPPNSDTDYIEAASVGDKVSVGLTAPTSTAGTIHTVVPYFLAKKTDAGAGSMKAGFRENSVDAMGADTGLGTSYTHYRGTPQDTAPDATAWDYTKIGNTELVMERTA